MEAEIETASGGDPESSLKCGDPTTLECIEDQTGL
jgi:hypothetical protein